jgi:hypothetical protein
LVALAPSAGVSARFDHRIEPSPGPCRLIGDALVPATKERKPMNKTKALPLDPEHAMSSVGWYVKRVYADLAARVDRLERKLEEQRRRSH